MKKRMKKRILLVFFRYILFIMQPLTVYATSISQLKQQKKENEEKLGELNEEISELTDESKGITEELEALDDLLVEVLASVSLLEEDVEEVEEKIEVTKAELDEAIKIEEKQYAANLIAKGISPERIRKYGFAFEGKKVLIG